jgi:hypothetical protein
MEFLNNLNLQEMTPLKALKLVGVVLGVLLLISIALQIVGSSFQSLTGSIGVPSVATAPSYGGIGMGGGADYDYATSQSYSREERAMMPQLSVRNVAGNSMYPPQHGSPVGDMAEAFEVTQYSAYIETRKLDETCKAFEELKARDDVIFENANTHDRGCTYTFKVKHSSVEEVLAWLKDLDPKELSENTYTIKQQIDDFTNEVEVLEKKRESIEQTLAQALNAYDEITELATRTQNADALAQIINSKISIIERLTQEKININEQLDRIARAKAEQLDRLDYTYFNATIVENKFVDGEELTDSWKQALRNFVARTNEALQNLSLNLILLLFWVLQWIIYALIALFVAKYGWKFARDVWNR